LGDKSGIGYTEGNIGIVYKVQSNYPKALEYYFKALKMAEDLGEKNLTAANVTNIGSIYYAQGYYPKALQYYLRALNIVEESGNKSGIANVTGNIGRIYTKQKNYKQAQIELDSSLALSLTIGDKDKIKDVELYLSQLDSSTGNYSLALEDYKKYIIYKDSLINEANTKKTVRTQMNFEFEQKQTTQKAEQDKKDAIAEADKRKQRIITRSVGSGLVLVLVFAGFILFSLRITRRQKKLIEKQKIVVEEQKQLVEEKNKMVEEKNKDILDSITYAKRLQDAILPPLSMIEKYLSESFVLYKPKDIVAGDFYWMERAGDTILIAAADCTGHGVPGALVSVVCSNALNRTVKEFKIYEPGKILDKVRELVLETFEKSESHVQDGMDISLCCINTKTNEAQWSGAFNSLWYIQHGEMKELAADKQPIGETNKPLPFNTHSLNLQKGDSLYLFTDGYADQFGGPKGKKFKYKQMQELLVTNATAPMAEQKKILDQTIEDWKGNLEQVDDILIIGIKI
jgi:serine phosphatase RsbU (regulator of sigma subunit)